MGTPAAEILAGTAFVEKAMQHSKQMFDAMTSYKEKTKLYCCNLSGYSGALLRVFDVIDEGVEDVKRFDEAHIALASRTIDRMTKSFDSLVLGPLAEWLVQVKQRKVDQKQYLDAKKKKVHYEKKIASIKDKFSKGKTSADYLRKNEEKLRESQKRYASTELASLEATRKFKLEHTKTMRTIVARLMQFETQLYKELMSMSKKLDDSVARLLDHSCVVKKFQSSHSLSSCQGENATVTNADNESGAPPPPLKPKPRIPHSFGVQSDNTSLTVKNSPLKGITGTVNADEIPADEGNAWGAGINSEDGWEEANFDTDWGNFPAQASTMQENVAWEASFGANHTAEEAPVGANLENSVSKQACTTDAFDVNPEDFFQSSVFQPRGAPAGTSAGSFANSHTLLPQEQAETDINEGGGFVPSKPPPRYPTPNESKNPFFDF